MKSSAAVPLLRRFRRHGRRSASILCCLWLTFGSTAGAQPPACESTPFFAHRGHPARAENSMASVHAALEDGFAGAEFDVQMLAGDDNWALHHDLLPGRVISGVPNRALRGILAAEWQGGTLRDPKRSSHAEKPALLDTVLEALPRQRPDGWRMFIEVKGFPTPDQARALVSMVSRHAPLSSVVFASLSAETLGYLRAAAPGVGLAWVLIDPQVGRNALRPDEWKLIREQGHHVGVSDRDVMHVLQSGDRLTKDPDLMASARRQLGPNLTIVLNVEMLARRPELAARIRAEGAKVYTYALVGDEGQHARTLALVANATGVWPDGAVINEIPKRFCEVVASHLQHLAHGAAASAAASAPVGASSPTAPPARPAPTPRAPASAPTAPMDFDWPASAPRRR